MTPHSVPASIATSSSRSSERVLLLLAPYAVLVAAYVVLRYAGRLLDGDSLKLTELSQNVLVEGTLSPDAGGYPFGYAFPALNTFLAHATGLLIETLQSSVQPFLVVMLIPVVYSAYRSLSGYSSAALLATLLLFLSPEFLFEATRSSHAKVTWLLALTALAALARSFRSDGSSRRLARWVLLFYLAAFALITTNSFFASSYIFGIALAFLVSLVLMRVSSTRDLVGSQMLRLTYVTISTLLLVFLFIFYLYPPATNQFSTMRSVADRLAAFFLDVDSTVAGASPYAYIEATWLSTQVYLALTSFNWFILLLSFVVWLRKGWSLLVRRKSMSSNTLLLWLLYASFAALMVITLLVDRAGALSSNMQVRIFPHFLLMGIPLASEGIVRFLAWARRRPPARVGRLAQVGLVILIAYFALASLLKITNEPIFSNYWPFYSTTERLSVEWIRDRVRHNWIWLGSDTRLRTLATYYGDWEPSGVAVERSAAPSNSRYVLASGISGMRADRMGTPLPDVAPLSRVYDAGGVEIYYSRPQTPYQR